jgi:isopentenyl-diphosphate delta-isomerase
MLEWSNILHAELGTQCQVENLILSGGVSDFMDGYYLIRKSALAAVYGQASGFLKYAQNDYETLRNYIQSQIRGLELAYAFLQVK